MPHPLPVRRPLAPALRARLLGIGILFLALVVLAVVLVAWVLSMPGAVVSVAVAAAALGVAALVVVLLPPHWVVRLDEDGYRVRGLRSARVRRARWSDVRDVQAHTLGGVRCTVLRLRDGGTTTLPVDALAGDPSELTAAIAEQLDRTHGYRRLR